MCQIFLVSNFCPGKVKNASLGYSGKMQKSNVRLNEIMKNTEFHFLVDYTLHA